MLTYSFDDRGMDFLYEHLYKEIKNDILIGNLKAHEKLPSKRALAAHLNVSVVTVENAYSQLLAEGYIYSKPKSGFYVCDVKAEDADVVGVRNAYYASEYKGGTEGSVMKDNARQNMTSDESDVAYLRGIRSEDHVTEHSHVIREHAESPGQNRFFADFVNNSTLSENFPFSTWTKLMRETMMDDREKLMKRSPSGGIFELRKAIADYLYQFRGMSVSPNQIIVGAGTEYLYGLIIQLLGRDSVYGVENPGYQKIQHIYDAYQVKCCYIDMDESGVNIDSLERSGADVVHISPSHHFPTGTVTPASRRYELLGWAAKQEGRYIIEDEYDSEFRLVGNPIPALQSIDASDKVIYMNTFSKSLSSTIRISYMVLPIPLMVRYNHVLSFYACTVSNFDQVYTHKVYPGGVSGKAHQQDEKVLQEQQGQDTRLYQESQAVSTGNDKGRECRSSFPYGDRHVIHGQRDGGQGCRGRNQHIQPQPVLPRKRAGGQPHTGYQLFGHRRRHNRGSL